MDPSQRALATSSYSQAARAFLHKDFEAAANAISSTLDQLPAADSEWYTDLPNRLSETEDDVAELRRKAAVFVITLFATIWAAGAQLRLSSIDRTSEPISKLAASKASNAGQQFDLLFGFATDLYAPIKRRSLQANSGSLPIAVAVTLTLAGAKLHALDKSKHFVQSYLKAVPKGIMHQVFEYGESNSNSDAEEAGDASIASIKSIDSMHLSTSESAKSLSDSGFGSASVIGAQISPKTYGTSLSGSLDRLADAYVLAVLSRLEQWDEAQAWIQSACGGERTMLSESKANGLKAGIARAQRQKAAAKDKRASLLEDAKQAKIAAQNAIAASSERATSVRSSRSTSRSKESRSPEVPASRKPASLQTSKSKSRLDVPERPRILRILSDTSNADDGDGKENEPQGLAAMRLALARFLAPPATQARQEMSAPYQQSPSFLSTIRYALTAILLRATTMDFVAALAGIIAVTAIFRQRARQRVRNAIITSWQALYKTIKMGTTVSSI